MLSFFPVLPKVFSTVASPNPRLETKLLPSMKVCSQLETIPFLQSPSTHGPGTSSGGKDYLLSYLAPSVVDTQQRNEDCWC